MKPTKLLLATVALGCLIGPASLRAAEEEPIVIPGTTWSLNAKPTPISLSGFSGEVDQVLRFDLEVMGCKIVPADQAQYQVTGSNNGRVEARVMDTVSKAQKLGKAYTGGTARQQAHALADDIVALLPDHGKGIARTRIAFKVDSGRNSEIGVADYDGFGAQRVTSDNTLNKAPAWVPGRNALYYSSQKFGNTDIFLQDLSTGDRRTFAQYPGSSMSPAVSAGGNKVAMILSKDGWTDVYACNADGSGLVRLTKSKEDESSPCWSPDGKYVCFAGKVNERRGLYRVPAGGGELQRIATAGVSSPTEPDWSPDGKWIAFTAQRGGGFDICVVEVSSGRVSVLVEGEDPSWAPNSRNLVYARRAGGGRVLSLLDVPTKQFKDVRRISGGASQPSWAK
jgi:TolB protein